MKTRRYSEKGAVLFTVLILATALALMAGALIVFSTNERKLNRRGFLRLQAQDTAEAALEYVASQLPSQLSQSTIATDYFSAKPVTLFKTSQLSDGTSANTVKYLGSADCQLWISALTPIVPSVYHSTSDDPLNGRSANSQAVYLMAQSAATDTSGNSSTSYAEEKVEIDDIPIFQYAIFYNVPLEIHPSFDLNVYGPVFCNKNIYFTVSSGHQMMFFSSFDTAQSMYAYPIDVADTKNNNRPSGDNAHNVYFTDGLTSANDTDPTVNKYTSLNSYATQYTIATGVTQDFFSIDDPHVQVVDATDPKNPVNDTTSLGATVDSALNQTVAVTATSGKTIDTTFDFNTAANQLWQGNVLNNVQPEPLPGIPASGDAHVIIEPPDPTVTTSSSQDAQNGEAAKLAKQAHLYIVVEPNHDGAKGDDGTAPDGAVITAFTNYQDALNYEYSDLTGGNKRDAAERLNWLSANSSKVLFSSGGAYTTNSLAGIVNPTRLMYDTREGKAINAVDIDMGALKTAISTNGITTGSSSGTAWSIDDPSSGWNGLVYVDVQTDAGDSNSNNGSAIAGGWTTTSTFTNASGKQVDPSITGTGSETAVRLVNGESLPNHGTNAGTSVVTNAPVYIVGNYNADGTLQGGAAPTPQQIMSPDSASNGDSVTEVPAMVAGDSINVLSAAWWDSTNKLPIGDSSVTTTKGKSSGSIQSAADTEIAAALISGIVATTSSTDQSNSDSVNTGTYNYSGGVENYFRLHEDWSTTSKSINTANGNTNTTGASLFRYRGSIVGLYYSKVATGFWQHSGGSSYKIPTRQWAFDTMFKDTWPPGAPHARVLRRLTYEDLTPAEFASRKSAGTWYAQ